MIRLLFLFITASVAFAHEVSEAFLHVQRDGTSATGHCELALRDAELAIGLDANQDDVITWGEIATAKPRIIAALQRSLRVGGSVPKLTGIDVIDRPAGKYLVLNFSAKGFIEDAPAVRYDFMFQYDLTHRALLKFSDASGESVATLTPSTREYRHASTPRVSIVEFIRVGISHILEGADHIAFLLTLLLPAVIGAANELRARDALLRICKIVTAFTVAHSITLALAVFDLIHFSSRIVESTIAASVLIAATNNLYPIWKDRSWLIAFAFGLIHGFGFASALSELQLARANLAPALFGFNTGVEFGQLAIVAVFFPIAFAIRQSWFYRRVILAGGSASIALIASAWLIERAFAIPILSSTLPK